MIVIRSEGTKLAPIVGCDACGEQIQEPSGWAWTLTPADGAARTGEAFFTHLTCTSLFLSHNPSPSGWSWARADIHAMLTLLAENTLPPRQKHPVVKRLH